MKIQIVVDNECHQKHEEYYKTFASDVDVIYTDYEDSLIRKVRNYSIVGSFLYHVLMWKKSMNYAKKIIKTEGDNVLCINPLVGLFLGLFNRGHKNIVLAGFLFEPKKNKLYYSLRKILVNLSLKNIKDIVVYSEREVSYYARIFPKYKQKFKFIHYGLDYTDEKTYEGFLPNEFVFSGGGSNRDYDTLIKAYELSYLSEPLIIANQPWRIPKTDDSRIEILSDVVLETFGDVLGNSKMLVLSLKDVELSAGHMVMLQGMSLGVPIIVNDIPAVRDYVDESMVTFYQSGDILQLKNLLEKFDPNSIEIRKKADNAKSQYWKKYTSRGLMDRLVALLNL
ncbi:glycosyltransferase [Streptococcus himalayensis]|uniref:Glycosyltransferase n=1 Tax=Streptococcus himalayensis TaxID=1888195 RepID=A0A917ECT4_9STRE|nr:glycosyltransferase [Streptococcus himalayensis]GGE22965.1 hypothetical protein GCM10011510_00060 [Streptococcus himalayensis]